MGEARVDRQQGSGPALRLAVALALQAGGCQGSATASLPAAAGTVRERVAALALRQIAFGSLSLLPVRFENSRIAGPFADGTRTLYCVSSHMKGRTFGKAERPKAVIRDEGSALSIVEDDEEACSGHRAEPFPELEAQATLSR